MEQTVLNIKNIEKEFEFDFKLSWSFGLSSLGDLFFGGLDGLLSFRMGTLQQMKGNLMQSP